MIDKNTCHDWDALSNPNSLRYGKLTLSLEIDSDARFSVVMMSIERIELDGISWKLWHIRYEREKIIIST